MRLFVVVSSVTLLITGCSATPELQKARRINEHRVMTYSPVNGRNYRLPPFESPAQESPRAMPDLKAFSYSPFKPEPDVVAVNKGRMMKVDPRAQRQNKTVVSYSPLTGEAVVVPGR